MSPFFQVINKNLYKSLSREDMTSQNVLKKTVTAAVSPTKLISSGIQGTYTYYLVNLPDTH